MLFIGLMTVALLGLSFGSPTGAPQTACTTLKPNHRGNKPQPISKLPYSVTLSTDTFRSPNDKITVSIKSLDGKTTFKGFLIAAKNEAGKAFGSWAKSTSAHELSSCSAITHNDNTDKLSAEVKWQPPSNATTGKVVMTAAVVQNFSIFWVNIAVSMGTTQASAIHAGATPAIAPSKIRPIPIKATNLKTNPNPSEKHGKPNQAGTKPLTASKR